MQKHDDGNLDAGVLEFAGCPHHRLGVERLDLLPVGVHAPADLAHQGARHQRLWPPGVKAHRVRHSKALKFKEVAEAGRNEQSDAGALAFNQSIRRDRAAMGVDDPLPRRLIALEGRLDLGDTTQDAGTGRETEYSAP